MQWYVVVVRVAVEDDVCGIVVVVVVVRVVVQLAAPPANSSLPSLQSLWPSHIHFLYVHSSMELHINCSFPHEKIVVVVEVELIVTVVVDVSDVAVRVVVLHPPKSPCSYSSITSSNKLVAA